ncbi:hypothetical protein G5I_12506 [Acromyrmex echinatior]|uniref:Uncharacterized protein n=1 Tax=Acromyrmex echinatior TaxID=103372 RepID=F4X2H7_ACREC|nr:hypothetical protein G5I_12506 [Acromyrmex echinatior]
MPDGDTRYPAAVLAKVLRSDVLLTGNMIWSLNLERFSYGLAKLTQSRTQEASQEKHRKASIPIITRIQTGQFIFPQARHQLRRAHLRQKYQDRASFDIPVDLTFDNPTKPTAPIRMLHKTGRLFPKTSLNNPRKTRNKKSTPELQKHRKSKT